MTFPMPNLIPALPEIFVLVMVSLILIIDLFLSAKNRFITYALTQITLLGAAWITVSTHGAVPEYTFSNMFVDDAMSDVLKLMSYIAVSVVLVYSRTYISQRGMFRGEFFALALFALLGMMVMISANHFLVLYMGLELLSLSLYAMVALQRDSSVATEAAMKYFVLGALASGLLLYGMSMLYGATGSLNINQVATVIQHSTGNHVVLTFGLVFIVAGLAFKLGVVPFHMWIPDVYQGAPTAVTLFIGSAPKIAAFAFVMRLLVEGLQGLVQDWQGMLVIMAVLSMAIGNIVAIAQTNIKRMLAYSTISHMGFLLLGFLSGSLNGYSSSMFYVLVYVLMSVGGFGMVLLMSRQGFEAENLDDFKGLNQRKPWYAFMMLLFMFSMAGIPPTVGFYAKLSVLQAALQAGFLWLVVAAVLFSVIGAFYYLRIIKLMYFDAPLDDTPIRPEGDMAILMSTNGLAVLALGIMPQPLMALCAYAIQRSLL
ncbi:MAG: NADH-quinone oxidoreductase subunit NuoN [Pseudomonadota bacterium]|jgi:NADH-quinone oxidoreductase subunit N|nr:NADH-quinone oxidoreductase subunit NuoN [Gammaproteobacteria bacterium]MBU1733550.1 NADH-quinone oxidoreductase subunit NuoN [Gammaproteobacteria bacterium]MBU1891734.1 NADH-quinone oxidoreductase subunit NuoN [Gammaproteobacteria bacterium]